MDPEHDRRFRRIVSDYLTRPAGDYGELLARGQVSSPDGVDPEAWRASIRAQARRDKIRVATIRDGDHAFALRRRGYSDAEMRTELERGWELQRLGVTARRLGHEPVGWIRDDDESVTFCGRCDARIYARTGPPVADGEALSAQCPADCTSAAAR